MKILITLWDKWERALGLGPFKDAIARIECDQASLAAQSKRLKDILRYG